MKRFVLFAALLSLPACAALTAPNTPAPPAPPQFVHTLDCPEGLSVMTRSELYFGLSNAKGRIRPRAFQAFVDKEIVPRLPEGFTILNGEGAWKGETGPVREDSRVLVRLHDGSEAADAALSAIADAYKREFAQEAVMRVDEPVCARF